MPRTFLPVLFAGLTAVLATAGFPSAASERRDIVRIEKKLYSRGAEEVIVRDFFQDKRGGVFLDVGCWHPITASNTYYLEHHLGWSGVAVDALPELAPKWKRNRPASQFFNFYVSDHIEESAPFFRAQFSDISSGKKPETGPGGKPVKSEELKVPTITLTALLDRAKVSHVDFVSMDIEGAEIQALAGFDIERFKPALLAVEAKVENRAKLLEYFKARGYERIMKYEPYDKTNWYFAPTR